MLIRRLFSSGNVSFHRKGRCLFSSLFNFYQSDTGSLSSQVKYKSLYNVVMPQNEYLEFKFRPMNNVIDLRNFDSDLAILRLQEGKRLFPYPDIVFKQVVKREAAVLVPLFTAEEHLYVLLCKRTTKLSTHKGEVCLPGGRVDEKDKDACMTALRETEEEVGISPGGVQILSNLPAVVSKHGVRVHPVVGLLSPLASASCFTPGCLALTLNRSEVAEVFTTPLHAFLHTSGHRFEDRTYETCRKRVHFFDIGGQTIWGLTASILIETARIAYDREPDFVMHCDPSIPGPQT
mmetsp:Transcript_28933/g.39961  ORF Transcript_28933/g.39961 Transcript_28933/m.39961 type:complete len:291 (+) Transcript_28933:182-1054(+)